MTPIVDSGCARISNPRVVLVHLYKDFSQRLVTGVTDNNRESVIGLRGLYGRVGQVQFR